jgi:hypothetical protein
MSLFSLCAPAAEAGQVRGGDCSIGGDDAGYQGSTNNCGIYALNNVIEDRLRSFHDIPDYDPAAGALLMANQEWEWNGGLIEDNGTTMENLVDLVNDFLAEGNTLPTKDGRGVTFTVSSTCHSGPDEAEASDIVLAREYDGRGNHFMEVESFDGETIYTQNSWKREMKTSVPDDDDFEEAVYIYKILLTDVEKC